MSSTMDVFFGPMLPEEIPVAFEDSARLTEEEWWEWIQSVFIAIHEIYESGERDRISRVSSRNWWFQHMLHRIAESHGIRGLEFNYPSACPGGNPPSSLTILERPGILAALNALREVPKLCRKTIPGMDAYINSFLQSYEEGLYEQAEAKGEVHDEIEGGWSTENMLLVFFTYLKSLQASLARALDMNEPFCFIMFTGYGRKEHED